MRPGHALLVAAGRANSPPSQSQPASFVAGGPSVSLPPVVLPVHSRKPAVPALRLLGMPACLLLYPETLPALSLAFCNAAQCRARGVCAAC